MSVPNRTAAVASVKPRQRSAVIRTAIDMILTQSDAEFDNMCAEHRLARIESLKAEAQAR